MTDSNRSDGNMVFQISSCSRTREKELTSSKGRVSLKQLSQTSFTARSAAPLSGHVGLA